MRVRALRRLAATLAAGAALAACQGGSGPGALDVASGDSGAVATMDRVIAAAQTCWFKSGDSAFRAYRLADERVSFNDRPRFLLVPRRNPAERPLLVVQASGKPVRVEAFGPMMSQGVGNRISSDVKRWAGGNSNCSATG